MHTRGARPGPARTAWGILALALVPAATAAAQSFVNWETPHVSPLALTPSGNTLLAVNTPDNRLEIFDVSSGVPVAVGSVPVGLDPVSVRARTENEAWVVNHVSDSISVVDLPSRRVIRTITVGDEPADVVFAGNPQRAFVSMSQQNRLVRLDPFNPAAPPTSIPIQGEDPRSLAVSPDGATVYAAIFESGNHTTILGEGPLNNPNGPYGGQNPPPNAGSGFDPPMTPGLPTPPRVSLIVRKGADNVWRDDNGTGWNAFVNWDLHDHDVAIIDAQTLAVTYASGLMTTVTAVSAGPDGSVLAVGTEAINEKRFEANVNGIFIRAVAASFPAGNPGATSRTDLNPHLDYSQPSVSGALRQQSIGDPRGIARSPDGSAWVSGMGSGTLLHTSASGARLGQVPVGAGPTGVAIRADGSRLWVLNRFEASISTVDPAAMQEVARTSFYDPTPAAIRDGRPFLYDTHLTSGLGQASCASCHVDGRTDHLAWDLGNPAGAMQAFDEDCRTQTCIAWHPMKGPMVTQTLQGIIGTEPFHWRGEKADLSEFNVAFTGLMGADAELSAGDMQKLSAFVASIRFPPNPNRNLDNTLKTSIPVAGGTGNAQNGFTIFTTAPTLGGGPCTQCHALPTGTDRTIDPPIGPEPQNRKIAQLRNMHEKTGADHNSLQGNRGFGFNHDSEFFTLQELLNVGFAFPPGAPGVQGRRDVEAFLLSFSVDTHAGVGAQATLANGGGAGDNVTLVNQMLTLAGQSQVGLVVKGRSGGIARGWAFQGGSFQSDRAAETISPAALIALAQPGSELTWTMVPFGSQVRIGIDRDLDGFLDRDELDAGSNPADPESTPSNVCVADLAPAGGDGLVNGADLGVVLSQWGGNGSADLDHNGIVNGADMAIVLAAWGACP